MDATVLSETVGGITRLVLNRPRQCNALTPEMLILIGEKLAEAEADPKTQCIVIEGAGEHFVAGGDITAWVDTLAMAPQVRGQEFKNRIAAVMPLMETLDTLSKPLVAAVRGYAIGGGLCFVLAADFVVADEAALFIFANIRAGVNPDLGLTHYLPRIVGERAAHRLCALGARLTASEAEKLGIVSQVTRAGELQSAVEQLTARLLAAPLQALGETKFLMRMSHLTPLAEQISAEAESFARCAQDDDFVEAVTAFSERREPEFGRRRAVSQAHGPHRL